MVPSPTSLQTVVIDDCEIELFRKGSGPPLLYLHGIDGPDHSARFLHDLANRFDIIAPTHPGFGASPRPARFTRIDDLAFLYLALIDQLALDQPILIGSSLGGWIAAELASWCSHALSKLILVAPLGLKTDQESSAADIFIRNSEAVAALLYHDPARRALDSGPLSAERLAATSRNREALAHYAWDPYMHNPQLTHRLRRISVPTLIVRGASDGFVSQAYIDAYSQKIVGSHIETISAAGHEPHLEQPEEFLARIIAFVNF